MTDEPTAPLKVEEAARLLRISRATGYRRVADGTIRSVRLGRLIRVPRAAIEELLNGGAARAVGE
ncbi:MAG: helix-turn-helix domain-containing protein [Chloroflexi bacterium]|nr:MAG: helix-turn-helix domain-containing protein [Chloroflexota bacterium]